MQKLDGTFGMNPSQLVDVAFKVLREQQQKKDAQQNATVLAVALDSRRASNPKRGRPPLGKEQYAYCEEEEHWKTDCPRLKQKNNTRREPLLVERNTLNEETQGLPWP